MPDSTFLPSPVEKNPPDYAGLVKFLMQPLLDMPDRLKIDCEQSNRAQRVWIRLAFESADKGRVFGRGGRNIQAVRAVLEIAGKTAEQSIYLDIYENSDRTFDREENDFGEKPERKNRRFRRPPSQSSPKFRQ
jgi:uncharacterized protein